MARLPQPVAHVPRRRLGARRAPRPARRRSRLGRRRRHAGDDARRRASGRWAATFPVFLHPETHEEYALARTERKHGRGYRGFEFFASPDVTLEEDLARRDLTINAMARGEDGALIDPHRRRRPICAPGVLRHVSPAFAEDPLRVLRVARFAARFGFAVAPETEALMRAIVALGRARHAGARARLAGARARPDGGAAVAHARGAARMRRAGRAAAGSRRAVSACRSRPRIIRKSTPACTSRWRSIAPPRTTRRCRCATRCSRTISARRHRPRRAAAPHRARAAQRAHRRRIVGSGCGPIDCRDAARLAARWHGVVHRAARAAAGDDARPAACRRMRCAGPSASTRCSRRARADACSRPGAPQRLCAGRDPARGAGRRASASMRGAIARAHGHADAIRRRSAQRDCDALRQCDAQPRGWTALDASAAASTAQTRYATALITSAAARISARTGSGSGDRAGFAAPSRHGASRRRASASTMARLFASASGSASMCAVRCSSTWRSVSTTKPRFDAIAGQPGDDADRERARVPQRIRAATARSSSSASRACVHARCSSSSRAAAAKRALDRRDRARRAPARHRAPARRLRPCD